MVYRWQCRQCSYTVFSGTEAATAETVKSHLMEHYSEQLTSEDFRVGWECPYCDQTAKSHDVEDGVARFKNHLFSHVEPLIEAGAHVADNINGTGNILVQSQLNSPGADNARVHLLSPGDILLIVTTSPVARLRVLNERLSEWPAWTIVLTTKTEPLAGVEEIDLDTTPLEIIQLDKRLGLSDLGETISRVMDEQDTTSSKLALEFDIMSEILDKFGMQTVFQFLHILTNRLETAGALSHFFINPQTQSASTINMVDKLFDISITVHGQQFVVETDTG
jgi:rubredoxin